MVDRNKKARKTYEEYLKCKIPAGHDIHHIIPVVLGGTDDIDNLLLMHRKDHEKVTLCYIKNFPTNDEILEASKALKYWMSVKESKNMPEPDNSYDAEFTEYQQFMIDNKPEILRVKMEKSLSNTELVKYKDFKDKFGSARAFRDNRIKLGWDEPIWDDRLNGIWAEKVSKAHKGRKDSEETKRKKSKASKGKPKSEEHKKNLMETILSQCYNVEAFNNTLFKALKEATLHIKAKNYFLKYNHLNMGL